MKNFRKIFVAIFLGFVLTTTGCTTHPTEQPVRIEYKYNKVPDQLLVIPDKVPPMKFTEQTSQKDVSLYMLKHYKREKNLENQILLIKDYQDKSLSH